MKKCVAAKQALAARGRAPPAGTNPNATVQTVVIMVSGIQWSLEKPPAGRQGVRCESRSDAHQRLRVVVLQ